MKNCLVVLPGAPQILCGVEAPRGGVPEPLNNNSNPPDVFEGDI